MKDPDWLEIMKSTADIRLFASLCIRRTGREHTVSAQELDALFRIALSERGMTPLELSSSMGVRKTIISRVVEGLYQKSYLTKIQNEADRRSYSLRITEKGKEELHHMYLYYVEPVYGLLRGLGREETTELMRLIRQANTCLQEQSGNEEEKE